MKTLSKLLCAVLVLAMLCSSLIFIVGAEEEVPAYSSVPVLGNAEIMEAIKYGADDNLLTGISLVTATNNGWNNPGALQSHIVTNNKTGDKYLHIYPDGEFDLNSATANGNEYFQFNFNTATLQYEEGYSEYIVLDYDLAYTPKTGSFYIPSQDKTVTTSNLKHEVIARGGANAWSNVQYFNTFGFDGAFNHITVVYDYTSGNAYIYNNGVLVNTVANGALHADTHPQYLNGTALSVSEWRIGSNSYDEVHLDNAYVRHVKVANAENTVDDAIASGNIADWDANIYNDDYQIPAHYWFNQTFAGVTPHAENKIPTSAPFMSGVANNNLSYVSVANNTNSPFITLGEVASQNPYVVAYCNETTSYKGANNNLFYQAVYGGSGFSEPFTVVGEETKGYYVVDLDLATHGNAFDIDVSVVMRRASDKAGFPFSDEIYINSYIKDNNAWNHLTLVGDLANNVVKVYVNGQFAGDAGLAVRNAAGDANRMNNDTQVAANGFRVELTRNNIQTDMSYGDNVALDNFSHRLFIENGDALTAAIADGDITDWADYERGRGGEKLGQIAIVNGVSYNNSAELNSALSTNSKLDVEFTGIPVTPVTLNANAVVNTNGLPKESLFVLGGECEIASEAGNVITTTAPFVSNMLVESIGTGGVLAIVKNDNPDNQIGSSLYAYLDSKTGAERAVNVVTDTTTGIKYVQDYSKPGVIDEVGSNTNVYIDWRTTNDKQLMTYELGVNQFIVFDIDFAIEKHGTNGTKINLNPITRTSGGSGVWGNNSAFIDNLFEHAGVADGEFAHITAVISPDTRAMYIFVNGQYLYHIDKAISDVQPGYYCNGIRTFSSSNAVADYTNASLRCVKDAELANAINAQDISLWSKNLYTADYVLPKAPAIATVDGVGYSTISSLNAALAAETEGAKNVEFCRPITETIEIRNEAIVETYGLDLNFDYETGLYQFHHDDPYYVCTGTDYAYASRSLVLDHQSDSTIYKFVTINQDNCQALATPVVWFNSLDPEEVTVVFYAYGDQIQPIDGDAYIEDGVLYATTWSLLDADLNVGEVVSEFPVASNEVSETWYYRGLSTSEPEFAADNIKQNAVVSTDIQMTVYVQKDQTITDGPVVVIGGVEYVAFSYEFAPHNIAETLTVEFLVQDDAGNTYLQKQNVSFVDYAKTLLESNEQSEEIKDLVAGMLKYSNEAHALLKGESIASVDALLDTYSENLPTATPTDVYETEGLSSVIRSAAMRLNSTPEFIFKVARGFKGTIELSYNGLAGAVSVAKVVDATECEQIITLDGFDVCDIYLDISIAVIPEGAEAATLTGTYNLSTYAQGLENPAFANALLAYAQNAKEYKLSHAIYVDGKLNVTDKDASEVESATLKTIVAKKIKQCDQANPGADLSSDYFTEGGTPRYVLANREDGSKVEALYFSRSVPWYNDQKVHFTEFRFAVNNEESGAFVTKITFNYLVNGTVEKNERYKFWDPFFKNEDGTTGTYFYTDAYVQVKTPVAYPHELDPKDAYPELSGTDLILDGQWHTMTIDLGAEGVEIIDILLNLYHFQGEMLISDLAIEYRA